MVIVKRTVTRMPQHDDNVSVDVEWKWDEEKQVFVSERGEQMTKEEAERLCKTKPDVYLITESTAFRVSRIKHSYVGTGYHWDWGWKIIHPDGTVEYRWDPCEECQRYFEELADTLEYWDEVYGDGQGGEESEDQESES